MTIEKFNLPIGRIVGGHPSKPENKINFQTKQPVVGEDGQIVQQYRVEYAIPKDKFLAEVWPRMVQEAATMYPINPQTGQPNVNRDFSWKMVDGDSPECPKNSKVPYNAREGYPGHYILTLKTEAFAPDVFKFENGAFRKVELHEIKCGDYLAANVNIKVHSNNDGGLYFNPNAFELVGYGTEIKSTGAADPNALFGQRQHQLPAGASATPMSSAPAGAGMPMAAPVAPMGAGMPMAPQAAPAHDFVHNTLAGAGMPMAPQPVAAPFAGVPQAPMTGQAYAAPATGSPTNAYGVPGVPPAR